MTNTPAAVCQAATALARGARTTEEDMVRAREIFSAIGFVAEVEEEQIDAVTALAGSGPAFVYTVIEALAEGGTNCGLPPEISLGLATQTVRGAAQLALESGLSPGGIAPHGHHAGRDDGRRPRRDGEAGDRQRPARGGGSCDRARSGAGAGESPS